MSEILKVFITYLYTNTVVKQHPYRNANTTVKPKST